MLRRILLIPGIHDSGPAHWQSRWEHLYPQVRRIRQDDWDAPQCAEWVATIERAVEAETARPILVAHSLGCLAAAHWAAHTRIGSHGLLLVAVPDARSAKFPTAARGFEPLPATLHGARAVIVGSENDPYAIGRKAGLWWSAGAANPARPMPHNRPSADLAPYGCCGTLTNRLVS
jgi:predicted alpha/beta hydrolase family esterase